MLLAPLFALPLLIGTADAQARGLVIRLEVADIAPSTAIVVLKPPTGDPVRVECKDNGANPDVSAGDGVWAGASMVDGDTLAVSLEVDGKVIEGGTVSWNPEDTARDLAVSLSGGTVVVEAGVSTGGPPPEPPAGQGTPPAGEPGTPPGEGGTPPGGGGTSPGAGSGGATPSLPGAPRAAGSGDDGSLYIGFGLGVLVLVGVAWLWFRNRPSAPVTRAGSLTVVPEPGLLGSGSPSLADGLHLWIVPDADADAVLKPLLATMARHHRVLVVAPSKITVPGVYGGPVYRSANLRPSHVGDAAESLLREGGSVATLLAGTAADTATITDYADLLPTGMGCVCVLTQDPGVATLQRVTARRDGPVWVVQTAERTFRLVETAAGFVEESAAR
jgi:hypothetical protein